jgi:hypothetical protein
MSRVVIQGDASGTGDFTIAAPNSNTDRTLTLPDVAGTVLTSGSNTDFPAGSVIQVVQASSETSTSITATSWAALGGASITITPSSTSNKVLVSFSCGCYGQNNTWNQKLRILRGATVVRSSENYGFQNTTYWSSNAVYYSFLDSPSTTSATTYTLEVANGYHTGEFRYNYQGGTNSMLMLAQEIKG